MNINYRMTIHGNAAGWSDIRAIVIIIVVVVLTATHSGISAGVLGVLGR